MNDIIEGLLRLQDIDKKRFELIRVRDGYPVEVAQLQEQKKALDKELEESSKELKELQVKRSSLEKDVESNAVMIQKYETQLFQIKDNDSYKALQNEIKKLKEKNAVLEDEILEKMEAVEDSQAVLDAKKKELQQRESVLTEKQKECEAQVQHYNQEIQVCEQTRDACAKDINPHILARYERILQHTQDTAVAAIHNEECTGCFLRLTSQIVNETMGMKEMVHCPSCNRILYMASEV